MDGSGGLFSPSSTLFCDLIFERLKFAFILVAELQFGIQTCCCRLLFCVGRWGFKGVLGKVGEKITEGEPAFVGLNLVKGVDVPGLEGLLDVGEGPGPFWSATPLKVVKFGKAHRNFRGAL